MTHQECETLIRAIARLWPTVPNRAEADVATIRLWQLVLCDVPHDAAELVLIEASRAGERFPPTPGVIAQRVHAARDRAQGSGVPDADEAWAEVRREVGRRGYLGGYSAVDPIRWSHAAISSLVGSIGWRELCHGDEMVNRAHFMRLYPTMAERHRQEQVHVRTCEAFAISPDRILGELGSHD